jgi:hypothetical protein
MAHDPGIGFMWHKVSRRMEGVYNSGFVTGGAVVLFILAARAFK